MTTNAVVVTNTLPTSNGSYVDFTSSGFGTPDAAIVITSNANTTNNPQVNATYSVGFWTSAAQATGTALANDGVTTSNTGRKTQSGDVALQTALLSDNTFPVLTEISATATTDGLRLTKDTGSSGVARYATVILLKGLTNKSVGSVDLGTGTSAINVTAPGFRADLVFAFAIGAADDTASVHAILSFGAAHINASDVVSQGLISYSSEDALSANSDVDTMVRDDAVACQNFNGTLSWKASVGAHSSGFTITPSANASSDIIYYLAVELADPADAYVAIKDTITGTGDQAYTGAGFEPDVVILGQTMCTAVNTNTSQGYFSIGAGGPDTSEQCLGIIDEDAQTVSDNECYADTSNIVNIRSAVGSTDTIASLSSLDSDGWTLNYSDGSATARKMLAIALGDSTAGGGAQSISVTNSSETDAAQAVTPVLGAVTVTVSAATETETAQAITTTLTISVILTAVTESDSAQVISALTGGATSLTEATETDSAQTISVVVGGVTVVISAATESDTAQVISAVVGSGPQVISIVTATEADVAQAISLLNSLSVSVGVVSETDSASAISAVAGSVVITLNPAVESDTAQAISYAAPGSFTEEQLQEILAYVEAHSKRLIINGLNGEVIYQIPIA